MDWHQLTHRIEHDADFRRRVARHPAGVREAAGLSDQALDSLRAYAREVMAYHHEAPPPNPHLPEPAHQDAQERWDQRGDRAQERAEARLDEPDLPEDAVRGTVSGTWDAGPGVSTVRPTSASVPNPTGAGPGNIPVPIPGRAQGGGQHNPTADFVHPTPGVERHPGLDAAIARTREEPLDPRLVGDPLHPPPREHHPAQDADQEHLAHAHTRLDTALFQLISAEQPHEITSHIRELLVAAHHLVRDAATDPGNSHVEWNAHLLEAYHAWEHVTDASGSHESFTAARDHLVPYFQDLNGHAGVWRGHRTGSHSRYEDGDHYLTAIGTAATESAHHLHH